MHNQNLNLIEQHLEISIKNKGNEITLIGDKQNIDKAEEVLTALWKKLEKHQDVDLQDVQAALRFSSAKDTCLEQSAINSTANEQELTSFLDEENTIKTRKKLISPRSPHQAKYIEKMRAKDMVFGLGPGGTGKTYLAVAYAVMLYLEGKIERMIFTRPAVEAGENLGFLPGDIKEKIDPYLRPIYDALFDVMYGDKVSRKIESGEIEIAPLAFMRGRTLKNAFVLLDEAQNTTTTQMKMFLTRMGEGSKMVITGDRSQIDLPPKMTSGLNEAVDVLKGVHNVGFVNFTSQDVVRHKLVSEIVDAYDRHQS